jgi:hypothetical protein
MDMALPIQDRETNRRAREISAVAGKTITQSVNTALRDRMCVVVPVMEKS